MVFSLNYAHFGINLFYVFKLINFNNLIVFILRDKVILLNNLQKLLYYCILYMYDSIILWLKCIELPVLDIGR